MQPYDEAASCAHKVALKRRIGHIYMRKIIFKQCSPSEKKTMSLPTQSDFPIRFAETPENNEDQIFYVEWLSDITDFPGLEAVKNDEDWEVLSVKSAETGDRWSEIRIHDAASYAEIAEKNAAV